MASNDKRKLMEDFLSNFEAIAAEELGSLQSRQSFDGTLRIDLDRVFVSRSEGDRIIKRLSDLDPRRLIHAR